MTENEHPYFAFLSYSHQDNREQGTGTPEASRRCWGDWLHDALKNFSVPAEFVGQLNGRGEFIPEHISPIFREEPDRPETAELSAEIRRALEQSTGLVVVCSPRSAQSLHVNEVVRYFKQLGRSRHIFPLVVAGEPHASDGDQPGRSPENECLVPALRHPVRSDGTIDLTRRAGRYPFVDARHGAEKREILANDHRHAQADLEMAKIHLIALLLGVGFTGLWWREQKRHFFDLAEAQHQAAEARRELQAAQRQIREAQNQALENQNLPREVHSQIQEAQHQALAAQDQARAARQQLQELQNRVRDTQAELEAVRNRALAAESQVLAAQNQARGAQHELEATRDQVREAENKVRELENLAPAVPDPIPEIPGQDLAARAQAQDMQRQLEAARQEAQDAQTKFLEAQRQVQALQDQARDAQRQLEEVRQQVREARQPVATRPSQTRDAHNQSRTARRLVKVYAVLAVLALLAAGIAAAIALRQRQLARQAWAQATGTFDPAQGGLDQESIRQALRKIGAAEPDGNQRPHFDQLAAWIPRAEIPAALNASSLIVSDPQRRHFQKWLLIRLGWVNPESAMNCASGIEGKIVNDAGLSETSSYFQLAVLDNWMRTDLTGAFNWVCQLTDEDCRQRALEQMIPALAASNPQDTLARLNNLKPAPAAPSYMLLFQCWAAQDPVQAIEQRQQLPDQDQGGNMLCAILKVWVNQQPEAALNWVIAQPDSESKHQALEICISELAKTDIPRALALAETLPEGDRRSAVIAGLFARWAASDLAAAMTACQQLPDGLAKTKAWEAVLNQQIEESPASAAESVKNLGPGDYRPSAIAALCQHWADTDVAAALTWAQSLPAGPEQVAALNQISARWTQNDFPAATNWVATLPAGEIRNAAIQGLLSRWAPAAPEAALHWLVSFPATHAQPEQVQSVLKTWAQREPAAAAQWLGQLPADAASDDLVSAFLEGAVANYPEFAWQWTQTVTNETQRQTFQRQVTRQWMETNPSAATNRINPPAALPEITQ